MMMELQINGETKQTQAHTVRDLIEEQGLADQTVAVEVNQQIVPKAQHSQTPINHGDHIELVTLVGGG